MSMNKDFGAFELKQKIGSGGMASVYLAVQKALQRPVVLKILYPHLAEDEKLLQRFEREARAAAMMRHENIIQVIDMGRHEDVAYIAMEYVEGMDLKKWFEAHGTPPMEMAILMLRDLCRGLEHAHGHHIVHRDIKPANVMLTPDGMIKLMDFGLARSQSETSTQMTMVGSVLGTPAYMSPEQATGEAVDERSDIFSAGVLAYELLGGTRPFSGDSYSSVLRSILTVEPPDVTQFNPLISEDLARIVRSMLQKDVSKRASSISDLREALEDVIEQMGLHRGRDLLREYARDPQGTSERARKKRLARHLDQGLYYENMGLGKIDDALLEFRRVLFLDPDNSVARDHTRKLERERNQVATPAPSPPPPPAAATPPAATPAAAPGDEHTVAWTPEQAAAAMVTPPAPATPKPAPTPSPPAPAKPAPAPKPAAVRAPSPAPRPEPARPSKPETAKRGAPVQLMLGLGLGALVLVVGGIFVSQRMGSGGSSLPPSNPGPTTAVSPVIPPIPSGPIPGPEPAPAESTAASPLDAARAAFEAGRYDEVVTLSRALIQDKNLPRKDKRAARELLARGLARSKRGPDATEAFIALLRAHPGYQPPADLNSVERGSFETAKLSLASAAPATAPAPGGPSPTPPATSGGNATLHVKVTPFAASFMIDGKEVDANKSQFTATVKPGAHVVTVKHPTLGTQEWNVDLAANDTRSLSHDFAARTGSISVRAEPTWGDIYLDGVRIGQTTPWEIKSVLPGKHQVTVVREGWTIEGGAQQVELGPGESRTVGFKLKPRKK
jgi:serine/threonine-protein kinase